MKITEKDLYKFIFSPEEISLEMTEYINTHKNNFENELDFLLELKNKVDINLSDKLIKKIIEQIDNFQKIKEVVLNKEINPIKSENRFTLAAATPVKPPAFTSVTFRSVDNDYFAKVITTETSNRIFIFSSVKNSTGSTKVIIYPSGNSFEFEDNLPIIVEPKELIDSLVIRQL